MRKLLPLSLLVALTLIGPSVSSTSASVITYTAETTFRAATPSHNPPVQSFENVAKNAPGTGVSSLNANPFTLTSQTPGKEFGVYNAKTTNGAHATDGKSYVATTGGLQDYSLNFHFTTAVSSFGLYVTDFGDENANGTLSATITFTDGATQVFQVASGSNVNSNTQFFGLISNGLKIKDVSFSVFNDATIGFDEVYYDTENVPEPSSLALGAIGMMGLGFWRRKRAAV